MLCSENQFYVGRRRSEMLDDWRCRKTSRPTFKSERVADHIRFCKCQIYTEVLRPNFAISVTQLRTSCFLDASRRSKAPWLIFFIKRNSSLFSPDNTIKVSLTWRLTRIINYRSGIDAAFLCDLITSTVISALEPLGIKLRVFYWNDNHPLEIISGLSVLNEKVITS